MPLALVRPTGPELSRCELTHLAREPIDVGRALEEHAAYIRALEEAGCTVRALPRLPANPDAVFVEDAALVLDEVAVVLRPGALAREGEGSSVAEALAPHRECLRMEAPATADGGDVVRVGDTLLVGQTTRTNRAGLRALAHAVLPHGLRVKAVTVRGCLHLKTGCTALDEESLLVHAPWLDLHRSPDARHLQVPAHEPTGANVLVIGSVVLVPAHAPRTADLLAGEGYDVRTVDITELAKAEAGLTCMSLVLS